MNWLNISKGLAESEKTLMIVPKWPTQTWFPRKLEIAIEHIS